MNSLMISVGNRKGKLWIYALFSFFLCSLFLCSCSNDDGNAPMPEPPPQETGFDIHDPEGYFLYVRTGNSDGTYPRVFLLEFVPGKMLRSHAVSGEGTLYTYTLVDDHIIDVANGSLRFVFEDGTVWSNEASYHEIVLIKAPQSDQLLGKTFAGVYYRADLSVLHENFFYTFSSEGNTVDSGLDLGNTLRTDEYTSIGNFAARTELEGGDTEFMVLINGQLEVNYNEVGAPGVHHGIFGQQ